MQNLWLNLFQHSLTGCVWTFVAQAGNEMQHHSVHSNCTEGGKGGWFDQGHCYSTFLFLFFFLTKGGISVTDVDFNHGRTAIGHHRG